MLCGLLFHGYAWSAARILSYFFAYICQTWSGPDWSQSIFVLSVFVLISFFGLDNMLNKHQIEEQNETIEMAHHDDFSMTQDDLWV